MSTSSLFHATHGQQMRLSVVAGQFNTKIVVVFVYLEGGMTGHTGK